MQNLQGLSPKQKKEIVKEQLKDNPTRGYASLMADLELQIWHQKHKGIK